MTGVTTHDTVASMPTKETWGTLKPEQIYDGHRSLTPQRDAELGKVRTSLRLPAGAPALADAIVGHKGREEGDTSRNNLVARLLRAEAARLGLDVEAIEAKAERALRREVRARSKE